MTETFNTPLATDQYNLLHSGSYSGAQNVSFFANRVVFAGQVDEDLSLQTTWLQFAYDNVTEGAYTDVQIGQTIIIGTTDNLLYSAQVERLWDGRIRLSPDGTYVYTNISSANVPTGAYFWVLDTWQVEGVLSRPSTFDAATAIQLVDSTQTYLPLLPRATGLRSIYVGNADPDTGLFRIALSVTGYVEEYGASITGYQYTFRSGIATVISGSLTSPTVTVDIDPSACAVWGETWATLTVAQNDGVALTRVFGIKVHDEDHLPNVGFKNMQVRGAYDQGQNYVATLPAFAGINSILPGTPAVIWRDEETYGTTSGSLTGDNVDMFGWFQTEQDSIKGDKIYSTVTGATFQLASVGSRLAYLAMQLLIIINDNTPSLWDHMINACPRRAVWHVLTRHSTAAMLSDVAFDTDLSSEDYVFPYLPFSGKNLLDIPNAVLAQVNAAMEFAPDGRILACRDAQYISADQQADVPIIGNFTGQDGLVVGRTVSYDDSIGYVDGDGACWDSFHNGVTAFASRAPGIAQGTAQGSSQLSNQILVLGSFSNVAQAELNQRSGTFYAVSNLVEELTVDHTDGYNFIIPSRCQLFTWTLDDELVGPNNIQRVIYDTNTLWYAKSVTFTHDNVKGRRRIRVVYRRVVFTAAPGDTVPLPPPVPDTVSSYPPVPFPSLPDLPPWPDAGLTLAELPPNALKPPPGKITSKVGSTIIESDEDNAYVTQSFLQLTNPQWAGITPTDLGAFKIKQVIFDPLGPATNTCGAYLLASDGTNSAIWYTANVLQRPPEWTKGAEFSGLYNILRGTGVSGAVLAYAADAGAGTDFVDITYTAGTGPATARFGDLITITPFVGSVPSPYNQFVIDFSDCVEVKWVSGLVTNAGGPGDPSDFYWRGCNGAGDTYYLNYGSAAPVNAHVGETHVADHMSSTGYIGAGPFVLQVVGLYPPGSGNVSVRYSANYGATVGSALAVGTSFGAISGFDVQSAGSVSYAAADGAVYKATSLGGSYSSWYSIGGGANAVCLIIPYYKRNSTTVRNNTTSTPDVVVGCDDGTLLWVNGSTATATDITPSGVTEFYNANSITTAYGTHIAVFALKSGVGHLEISVDGGASWVDKTSLTSPHWIRGRRGDTSARLGAAYGQLYAGIDSVVPYSKSWDYTGGMKPRTIPNTASLSGDIYG